MQWGLLRWRFLWKGIRRAFQGILRAGWPWTYFLGGSFSAAPSPLQICGCLHWSFLCFLCFWSSGNWCGGNWFALGFLSSLGCRRMLGDVRGNGRRHRPGYKYCWYCRFCRGWLHFFCRRGRCGLILRFFGGFLFFAGDFNPIVRFLLLAPFQV